MKRQIRVRFAPSPTGYLHIGNARTALFNWLFTRKQSGGFILRIEDTNLERSGEQYVDSIMEDLRWLGLEWDEGPDIGGEFGPYRQSLRATIYQEYFEKLKSKELVYPCYCTPGELEERRRRALASGRAPRYDNRCRRLTSAECKRYEREGRRPSWRFKVSEKKIVVHDIVRGDVTFDTGLIGDFVIIREDGRPTFNFAVSIDDMCMKITHIIRGEDHLSNTPRHILLWEALGADIPVFAHNTLTLGPDGTRLSKRHGATSIREFRKLGYLPEGLINYMALLGWSPGDEPAKKPADKRELFSRQALVDTFSLEGLSSAAAVFDRGKLDWVNSYHIRNMDLARLTNLVIPYLKDAKLIKGTISEKRFTVLKQMVASIRDNLNTLDQSAVYMKIFLSETVSITDPDKILKADYIGLLFQTLHRMFRELEELNTENVKELLSKTQSALNITGKQFYLPVRLALTGTTSGPELMEIIPLIGKERILKRLERVIKK